jgi:mannose-6-phosphate isomerase-like protein (cupin superfamily)
VQWEALNPARGDMSPRAGTLWGDRNAEVPTGFLANFKDGFSSPAHIHNVTYRAVVISGGIHNDDSKAEKMWMGKGSFWTQPKGEVHITAARGKTNIALVEIDNGPYLVKPSAEAFDSGERPVNIDASNIVWLPIAQQSTQNEVASIAYLWGRIQQGAWSGSFVKLAPGFVGTIEAPGTTFHGVVIQGELTHGSSEGKTLKPGSYFGADGASSHEITTSLDSKTIIYIRTNDRFRVVAGG